VILQTAVFALRAARQREYDQHTELIAALREVKAAKALGYCGQSKVSQGTRSINQDKRACMMG